MIAAHETIRSIRHPVGTRVEVIHADAGHYATGVVTGFFTRLGDERYTIETNRGVITPVVHPERIPMGNSFTVTAIKAEIESVAAK